MALTGTLSCKPNSNGGWVLPPVWALARDFRMWILGLRYHANFSRTESASDSSWCTLLDLCCVNCTSQHDCNVTYMNREMCFRNAKRAMKKGLVLQGQIWRWFDAHLSNNFLLMRCFGKRKLPCEMEYGGNSTVGTAGSEENSK